jgi:hypothetical protein
MRATVRRRLLPVSLLLAASAAACVGSGPGRVSGGHDDASVINTAPRPTSRASSLVVIGYASRQDRPVVEQAVAILRDRSELASQRGREIRRLGLEQIEQIGLTACDSSCPPSDDILGTAQPDVGRNPLMVDCAVVLNMPQIRKSAGEWEAQLGGLAALVLVHEQEHCIRTPDGRETPAVAAELRLAQKLRDPRLVAFVRASYKRLDANGYWKR